MLETLNLRLRILLFFAFLGLGAITITTVALWLAYARLGHPDMLSAFVNAGLMSGFGVIGLTVFVWLLFDEHVAKPPACARAPTPRSTGGSTATRRAIWAISHRRRRR